MLPIRTRSVFKSRWMALLWAGGILWSAAEFAGERPHDGTAANDRNSADAADVQAAANLLAGIP